MNTLTLLSCTGLAVSMFTIIALLAGRGEARGARSLLAVVCLQASLLFLKDLVERSGGPGGIVTFLIFANFLFGLPSLYLFMRVTYGEPARRPLLHFVPFAANVPIAGLVARTAIGSEGIDGTLPSGFSAAALLPIVYINALALAENLQLVHYAGASLRYLRRRGQGPRERTYRRIVLGVAGCYGVYYALRWLGFGIRLARARGGEFPPLSPWVNPVSIIFLTLFVGAAGIYSITRPELIFGRDGAESKPKYGGKPLTGTDPGALLTRAGALLDGCVDLSRDSVNPRRLAAQLGVPYYVLSRAVNESCGQTVADLIREKRVQRAKTLLDECPDATILRVALEAGFPAKSSFNEAFKKTVGMSPREYRRQHGQSLPDA